MKTAEYIIRDVDPATWKRFKTRAARAEITMKAVFHLLIDGYARGDIRIAATNVPVPPETPATTQETETVTNG